jgi:GTPase SAR1 family protein
MIISIRGTSGCGKTTLVRRVKEWYSDEWDSQLENGKITGYTSRNLFIFGSYREGLQTGGADSTKWGPFRTREYRMNHLTGWLRNGYNVLFEGLMESNEVGRTVKWGELGPVHVIFLDTPLEICFDYIAKRRAARGVHTPVDPYQTTRKFSDLQRVSRRLVAAGVDATWMDRDAAYFQIQKLLKQGVNHAKRD